MLRFTTSMLRSTPRCSQSDERPVILPLPSPVKKEENWREVPMFITSISNQSPYGTVCRRCNDRLIAPNGSTYVSERHICHFWICDSCGQHFETSDQLEFHASSEARRRIPSSHCWLRENVDRPQSLKSFGAPPWAQPARKKEPQQTHALGLNHATRSWGLGGGWTSAT